HRLVAHHVPEREGAVAAEGAVAVNNLGPTVQHRIEQPGNVLRIVFEVGVEYDHEVPGGVRHSGPDRRALALISLVGDHPDAWIIDRAEDLRRAVAAPVVHHHQLDLAGVVHV